MQFGIYTDKAYNGMLTINLKASNGWRDWLINLMCWSRNEVHAGYKMELDRYYDDIMDTIKDTPELLTAADKGTLISGRSKGGAEALLLANRMIGFGVKLCGLVDAPKCTRYWTAAEDLTVSLVYKNDIVPRFFPWFKSVAKTVQLGSRTHGLSVRDHEIATTQEDIMYKLVEDLDD